jgi:predicted nucleic-acid-binding Zn-ribbon protein
VQVGNDTNNVINDTIDIFPDSAMNSPQMRIIGEDKDILIQGARGDRSLRILFNYSKDSIRYTFRTDSISNVFDTITFYYEPSVHFISNNCGYNYFYNIKKVAHTTHMIDSFAIPNSNVSDDAKTENVQLYFKRNF